MGDQDTNWPHKLPMDMNEPFFDTISFSPHCCLVQLREQVEPRRIIKPTVSAGDLKQNLYSCHL